MRRFLRNETGAIAIMFAILMPFLIYILWLGFDSSTMLAKHSRLDDASREANLAAATLKDKKDKDKVAQKFLDGYFGEKTKTKMDKFEDIEIKDENSSKKGVKFGAKLEDKSVFTPTASIEQDYTIATDSIIGQNATAAYGANTDYAFAIDFSSSMGNTRSQMFLRAEIDKLCRVTTEDDYDPEFCKKIQQNTITNLNIAQAVVHKILKILARYNADNVTYSIVPFSTVIQASRRHPYTLGNSYPDAKQLITPYVFKSKYRLANMNEYDKYSRSAKIDVDGSGFVYADRREGESGKKKAEALLTTILTAGGGYTGLIYFNTQLYYALPTIVDYKASIDRMFDLNAGFGFRLTSPDIVGNPIWYLDRTKKPPFTTFPSRKAIYVTSKKPNIPFDAGETPLKPLNKIANYKENPVVDPDDLINLTTTVVDYSTDIIVGMMRGATHLAKGKNARRVLVLVTDGEAGSSSVPTVLPYTAATFVNYGLCDEIKSGLARRGASKVEILVFVIGDKKKGKPFISDMKRCTDEKNIIFAENVDSFFKEFRKAVLGEGTSPSFMYEKIK